MAPETERPIDKLLRAYAKRRREEARAPFELGAEGRRRLLQEARALQVRKATGLAGLWTWLLGRGPEEEATAAGLWGLRQGLAVGLAIFLVLGGLAVVVLPELKSGDRGALMAKKIERAAVPAPRPPKDAAPVASTAPKPPATPPSAAIAAAGPQESRSADLASVPAPAAAGSGRGGSRVLLAGRSRGSNSTKLPSSAPPRPEAPQVAPLPPSSQPELAKRFIRVAPETDRSDFDSKAAGTAAGDQHPGPASRVLLAAFDLTLSGRDVRIVEDDGSVYLGLTHPLSAAPSEGRNLEVADVLSAQGATNGDLPQRLPTGALAASEFRVSGTNRSLGQPVVINGRLTLAPDSGLSAPAEGSNGLSAPLAGSGGRAGASGMAGARRASKAQADSEVSGKLTLDDGKEIEFRALSR